MKFQIDDASRPKMTNSYDCGCCVQFLRRLLVGAYDDRFGVEKGYALHFKESMVDGMSDEIARPLGNHDGNHDWKKKLNVVCNFQLKKEQTVRFGKSKLNKTYHYDG